MDNLYRIVLTTYPDAQAAEESARFVVESQLAACVNMVSGVRSIYRWQGEVVSDNEIVLIIKTRHDCYPALQEALRARHPYQVPEIISLAVENGLPEYLAWIDGSARPPPA
jgi:periplasmic divalent cation tolerance protein